MALLLPLLLWSAVSCERAPTGPVVVRDVVISLEAAALRPGRQMLAYATVLGPDGFAVDVPVTWASLTPELVSISPSGTLSALAVGTGVVQATAAGVSRRREVPLVNPPAVSLNIPLDTLELTLPGESVSQPVIALDSARELLIGSRVSWTSDAPRLVTVSSDGIVTPVAVGVATVTARLDSLVALRAVRVTPRASATAPFINVVTPGVIEPGVPFRISGSRFANTIAGNAVQVNGFAATVTAASDTAITATLSAASVPCLPTRDVAVQVTTVGGIGARATTLRVAPQRTLAVGEALLLTSAGQLGCNELTVGTGRYLLTVQNAGRSLGVGPIALSIDGATGAGGEVFVSPAPSVASNVSDAHLRLLEQSRRVAARAQARGGASPRIASLQLPPVNGIVQLRVPDLERAPLCANFSTIGARTAFVGARVAIFEDTASQFNGAPTLAGRMDEFYSELSSEFDAVFWPLSQRFGNALVMDTRLDANDRVAIVFTPQMNAMFGGDVLAAVVTCDFFPRAQFASSNVGEIIYVQVPTSEADGFAAGTRERWRYETRAAIAHELKHVTAFAERIVRGQPLEEPWLEEATARHAEELYLRARLGVSPTGDAGFTSIGCELRVLTGDASCAGTPRTMLPHFEGLWDFLSSRGAKSPLGPTSPGDVSFYGSGWSLTRWAIDHAATSEATILNQLVVSGQSGLTNLEARVGRTWDEMLARWSLALAAESRNPSDPTLRFPSWNIADVFAGLCTELGPCGGRSPGERFSRANPLVPIDVTKGNFVVSIAAIESGSFVALELAPLPAGTRRLLRLRGPAGSSLPPNARLAILRVE